MKSVLLKGKLLLLEMFTRHVLKSFTCTGSDFHFVPFLAFPGKTISIAFPSKSLIPRGIIDTTSIIVGHCLSGAVLKCILYRGDKVFRAKSDNLSMACMLTTHFMSIMSTLWS